MGRQLEALRKQQQTLERLQREGRLDVDRIVERSRQLCAEASARPDGGGRLASIRQGTLRVCEQLLKTASPKQLESEPYRRLAEHRRELRNELVRERCTAPRGRLRKTLLEYGRETDLLVRELRGRPPDARNGGEYGEMMKDLGLLNAKLCQLSGDPMKGVPPETLAKLPELDAMEQLEAAKKSCFAYACLEPNEGGEAAPPEAGTECFRAAARTFSLLGEISDEMGLRSPARRLCDSVQLSALLRRRQLLRDRESCERAAARVLYAKHLEQQNLPFAEQEKQLESGKLDQAVEEILQSPDFRRMVQSEGAEGLTRKLIRGGDELRDAYRQALRDGQSAVYEERKESPPTREPPAAAGAAILRDSSEFGRPPSL